MSMDSSNPFTSDDFGAELEKYKREMLEEKKAAKSKPKPVAKSSPKSASPKAQPSKPRGVVLKKKATTPKTQTPPAARTKADPVKKKNPFRPAYVVDDKEEIEEARKEAERKKREEAYVEKELELMKQRKINDRRRKMVEQQLNKKSKKVKEHQIKLMTLQNQLKQMDIAVARDIEALRGQIEAMGTNLSWYEGDMKAKKEAYVEAKKVVDQMREDKHNLQIKLQKIVETSETSRSKKLDELMKKLDEEEELEL